MKEPDLAQPPAVAIPYHNPSAEALGNVLAILHPWRSVAGRLVLPLVFSLRRHLALPQPARPCTQRGAALPTNTPLQTRALTLRTASPIARRPALDTAPGTRVAPNCQSADPKYKVLSLRTTPDLPRVRIHPTSNSTTAPWTPLELLVFQSGWISLSFISSTATRSWHPAVLFFSCNHYRLNARKAVAIPRGRTPQHGESGEVPLHRRC